MIHLIKSHVRINKDVSESDTIIINEVEYCLRRTDFDEITLYQIGVN